MNVADATGCPTFMQLYAVKGCDTRLRFRVNHSRQRPAEIALPGNNNRFEAQPTRHRLELGGEGWRDVAGLDMGLDIRSQN